MESVSKKVKILKRIKTSGHILTNSKVIDLNDNPEHIGTQLSAVHSMVIRDDEMKMIAPKIIHTAASSSNWEENLENYFNDIHVEVYSGGLELEIGFGFSISNAQRKVFIDELPTSAKASDKALAEYIMEQYETKKLKYEDIWKYGTPIKDDDYLLYRYCQNYRDVANTPGDVDKSSHIRFYILDSSYTKDLLEKDAKAGKELIIQLANLYSKREQLLNVLYVFKDPSVNGTESEQDVAIDLLAKKMPIEFMRTVKDQHLLSKATIARYISVGILEAIANTETVIDPVTKDVLGHTTMEVIAWFKVPTNKGTVADYEKKLKELTVKE